jgi:PAS domain S-box-containing protein
MKRLRLQLNSLCSQLLFGFIALVLLTAAATGLPAIKLIGNQLGQRAWMQVEQGAEAAWALYQARQSEIENLVIQITERPTLRELLARGDQASLNSYLQTIQTDAGLDLMLVCAPNRRIVAQSGLAVTENMCLAGQFSGFRIIQAKGTIPSVWLLAVRPISDKEVDSLGQVIAGIAMNEKFATQMAAQTGLEHTLLVRGRPVIASFPGGLMARSPLAARTEANAPALTRSLSSPLSTFLERYAFSLNDQPYYAAQFPLAAGREVELTYNLAVEVTLAVTDITAIRQRLAWTLIGSALVGAGLGSVLVLQLARRISQPLAHVTEAITRLGRGDLATPVPTLPWMPELALVASALEATRLNLQRRLNVLQEEQAWSSHLLASLAEGIITFDAYGRIAFFSQGAERITGWSREEVIGHRCDDILRPANTNQPLSQLMPALGRHTKIVVILPDHRQATLAMTGARFSPEGYPAQTAIVFRDISEEETRHRLVGHFLANIAHEFRTPLASLAASVELLLDHAPTLSRAEFKRLLTSFRLGVLGLQTLVDNLLESASIEAGRFRVSPRPSNLADLVTEVTATLRPLLAKRNQTLRLEIPVTVPLAQADPGRTSQVLVNLLANATKYSPPATEITVSLTVEAGWMRVNVADRGPGVPQEYRADLFRLFTRDWTGSNDHPARNGTGLGLSVVKAIVEAQGGQVGVDDRSGGGAIFWFTLPVVTDAEG